MPRRAGGSFEDLPERALVPPLDRRDDQLVVRRRENMQQEDPLVDGELRPRCPGVNVTIIASTERPAGAVKSKGIATKRESISLGWRVRRAQITSAFDF